MNRRLKAFLGVNLAEIKSTHFALQSIITASFILNKGLATLVRFIILDS